MQTKDDGTRRAFSTGAVRSGNKGKGRFDLLPADAIRAVAKVFQDGAETKGDRNWETGIPLSSFLDSALRHTFQALNGETDEPHAAQAAWNLLCYVQTREWIGRGILPAELDDIPKRVPRLRRQGRVVRTLPKAAGRESNR